MMSPDAIYLALSAAEADATKEGIDMEVFKEARLIVYRRWHNKWMRHPLSKMF